MLNVMNKFFILFLGFMFYWSNILADSNDTFTPVEITLRTGESYEIFEMTVKLLEARTKWTVSGSSALSVSMEISYRDKKENVYLTRVGETAVVERERMIIKLLNGDNGLVRLNIAPGD